MLETLDCSWIGHRQGCLAEASSGLSGRARPSPGQRLWHGDGSWSPTGGSSLWPLGRRSAEWRAELKALFPDTASGTPTPGAAEPLEMLPANFTDCPGYLPDGTEHLPPPKAPPPGTPNILCPSAQAGLLPGEASPVRSGVLSSRSPPPHLQTLG